MNTTRYSLPRRVLAAFTAFAMTLGPLTPGAYAATTTLTDQPLAAKVAAKPNIIYTLDDSGSMQLRYIPDYTSGTNPVNTPPGYCRHTNGTTNQACGVGTATFPSGTSSYAEPMYASEFNRLYYNPNINYEPPVDGSGNQANTAFPNGACGPGFTTSCATTYKMMNSANTLAWVRVPNDMYLLAPASLPPPTTTNTTNLTAKFNARVFCNTDWPAAAYSGPATATSVWTEVGDANGENSPPSGAKGADCRINGTEYAAVNGAPAIAAGYNYPWQKSSGADDPKYFWRNGGNRAIYCKTSAPGWPTSCVPGPQTCAGTITVTPPVAQTCVFTSNATTTGAPYTYNPVGCETNPLYQWTWAVGGCVGTIGVECLGCSRTGTTIVTGRNGACRLASTLTGGSGAGCSCAGAGCTLPACPNYDPADTCSTGWVAGAPICTPRSSANCNMTYGGTGGTGGIHAARRRQWCRHHLPSQQQYRRVRDLALRLAGAAGDVVQLQQAGERFQLRRPPHHRADTALLLHRVDGRVLQHAEDAGERSQRPVARLRQGHLPGQERPDDVQVRAVRHDDARRPRQRGRNYTYTDPFTGVAGTRTYAEEMTNYANWFAYYRTRILAAKTTSAIAFGNVDNSYRAGFHSLNLRNGGGTVAEWLDINTFDAAQRTAWYTKLFGISIGTGMTPTIDAVFRIGEVVKQGAGAVTGLPAHTDPIPTVAGNPVSLHEQLPHPVHRRRDEPADAADGRRRGGRLHHSAARRRRHAAARPGRGRTPSARWRRSSPAQPGRGRSATPRRRRPIRWRTSRCTTGTATCGRA